MSRDRKAAGGQESGFALLLVFLMAAVIAISLYMQIPRVAFESQRNQEELLIQRGEQYKRAIQLYYRALHKYPARIEDLENTNNQRFLRHRFVDPVTGKSEWRLIHIGPGGAFTDSKLAKNKPQQAKTDQSVNTFTAEGPAFGSTLTPTSQQRGPRRRASEGGQTPGDPSVQAGLMPAPSDPAAIAPQPDMAQPGMMQPGMVQPGMVQPGMIQPGVAQPANAAAASSGNFAGQVLNPDPNAPQQQNAAAQMMRQILFSPRQFPGGNPQGVGVQAPPFGSQQPQATQTPDMNPQSAGPSQTPGAFNNSSTPNSGMFGGRQVGAAIAGVASLSERDSIKIYNDQEEYDKWEFVYDFAKEKAGRGAGTSQVASATGSNGSADPNASGANNNGSNSVFATGGAGSRLGRSTAPVIRPGGGSGTGFGAGFGVSIGGGTGQAQPIPGVVNPGQPRPGQPGPFFQPVPGQPPPAPVQQPPDQQIPLPVPARPPSENTPVPAPPPQAEPPAETPVPMPELPEIPTEPPDQPEPQNPPQEPQ